MKKMVISTIRQLFLPLSCVRTCSECQNLLREGGGGLDYKEGA